MTTDQARAAPEAGVVDAIRKALIFSDWAAGEGLHATDQSIPDPSDFIAGLYETGDETPEQMVANTIAALATRPAETGEPFGWHRTGFTFSFSVGAEKPANATSSPDEWMALYASPPPDTRDAVIEELRAENERLETGLHIARGALLCIAATEGDQRAYAESVAIEVSGVAWPELTIALTAGGPTDGR